jgi:hypothetical protein
LSPRQTITFGPQFVNDSQSIEGLLFVSIFAAGRILCRVKKCVRVKSYAKQQDRRSTLHQTAVRGICSAWRIVAMVIAANLLGIGARRGQGMCCVDTPCGSLLFPEDFRQQPCLRGGHTPVKQWARFVRRCRVAIGMGRQHKSIAEFAKRLEYVARACKKSATTRQ